MKLIKKPQPEIVNLSEKYKVGQRIKVTTAHHDGRGHYDNCETLYTIEKVNRVTLDITNDDGYTIALILSVTTADEIIAPERLKLYKISSNEL